MRRAALRRLPGLGVALTLLVAPAALRAQALQHDTSLPIEITADQLEVAQRERVATFTGNVDAVQGELVLSADQLRVFYYGNRQDERPVGASGSIRRIEAEGNVFVSSPRETAQGKLGTYDVASNQLTLQGAVVLTQGENVVRGERLEMDLVSGRSRVLAAVAASEGAEPAQRVRAVFTPEQANPAAGPVTPDADPPARPRPADPPAAEPVTR
ncbi:MAG TPA: lipopolysaccharide transport periplasmic protein LptA [Geminicoccaceae bacterium]|nr:lipopolysaccharide transport periplasmic protein LptA [Geminicoccaceae bacterium]